MIKIDVISGFLGAGKTTFIKQLLKEDVFADELIVIVENEYGEVNMDANLLKESNTPIYEITKGCICCSLKGDFIMTLNEIKALNPDRVIIEPSGIFMLETLNELLMHEQLRDSYCLNSVTSILDLTLFDGRFLPMEMLIGNQIKFSNTVLLSKYIKSNKSNYDNALEFIQRFNENVNTINWNPRNLITPYINFIFNDCDKRDMSEEEDDTHHSHHNHKNHHSHDNIQSETIKTTRSISLNKFMLFIDSLKNGSYGDIIRMKGYLTVEGESIECQYTNQRFEYKKVTQSLIKSFVVIGHDINKKTLLNIFG